MVATSETISRSQRLHDAQARAARLRSEAFVDYTPEVCGIRLNPVTLNSFNSLDAFQNAFFTGGEIEFRDIVNFIWLHHPQFGQFSRGAKRRCTRKVWRYLNPRFSGLNDLIWFASLLPRFRWMACFRRPQQHTLRIEVIGEIRRILSEATSDMPIGDSSGDSSGEPMPYAFQAYLLNAMNRGLGLSFAETRSMPMKQLAQHYRELINHQSDGKAILLTREEAAIWAEDLGAKTEAAQEALRTGGKNHV